MEISSTATLSGLNSLRSPSISTPTEVPSDEADSNCPLISDSVAFDRKSFISGCSCADPKPHSEAYH